MAQTPSNMVSLGLPAPPFELYDTVTSELFSLPKDKGKVATVIMFICNHCPFVKHIAHELALLGKSYDKAQVSFLAISSNDAVKYPEDAPDKMRGNAIELGYNFPYLYDESQEVAKKYGAACTPDFLIYDENLNLVYRGQLDDSRPSNSIPVTGNDIRNAINALLKGEHISTIQKPSIGCNIKWR